MDKYKLKIKEFRRAKKLTQKQLSEKVGVSRSFLSEIENGKYDIGLDLLIKIGESLEMNALDLILYTYKK